MHYRWQTEAGTGIKFRKETDIETEQTKQPRSNTAAWLT